MVDPQHQHVNPTNICMIVILLTGGRHEFKTHFQLDLPVFSPLLISLFRILHKTWNVFLSFTWVLVIALSRSRSMKSVLPWKGRWWNMQAIPTNTQQNPVVNPYGFKWICYVFFDLVEIPLRQKQQVNTEWIQFYSVINVVRALKAQRLMCSMLLLSLTNSDL